MLIADISMSLDGYVAGPDARADQGLGISGEQLHYWMFGSDPAAGPAGVDKEVIDELFGEAGAVIVGRTMFDCGNGWGYENPFPMPCFVLTHRADPELAERAPSFTFVTDGIHSALAQAKAVAGDKNVLIGGGARVIQQYLAAGLVDELGIHLVPVLLGGGTRLFDGVIGRRLEQIRCVESPFATHLRFRIK